jgi:PAS domain S-box-containing protein
MMHEIARVTLDNELDLILAHKRSMKLAEITGLSLAAQTTFATAVSEVSRNSVGGRKKGQLILSIHLEQAEKYIVASLRNGQSPKNVPNTGLEYAKKLVTRSIVTTKDGETTTELFFVINPGYHIDITVLDNWRNAFRNEPAISPYDELKRRNIQLQILSEKLEKSEGEYKYLTNALPLIIFSLDVNGQLSYANDWLIKYTGQQLETLNNGGWKEIVHAEDYETFRVLFERGDLKNAEINIQARLRKNETGEFLWHQVLLSPMEEKQNDSFVRIGYIVDIHLQKLLEETLKDNQELKQTQAELRANEAELGKIIEELNRSNFELQQFAFIASHDLQEPVRKLLFYSDSLIKKYSGVIDETGAKFLRIIQVSATRMRILIQDLLSFSQINKERIKHEQVDLAEIAHSVLQDMELIIAEKSASITILPLSSIAADSRMMHQLFSNFISNSLKYSRDGIPPVLTISGKRVKKGYEIAFVDNGIGFEKKYLPQMLNLFQRLHSNEKFEGSGLGLAICRKIVELHHGSITAKSEENKGAVFFVTLPLNHRANNDIGTDPEN